MRRPASIALVGFLFAVVAPTAEGQCLAPLSSFASAVTGPVRVIEPSAELPGGPQRLFIGGSFTLGGGDNISYWDGVAWRTFGHGTDGPVNAIAFWDPDGSGPVAAQVIVAGAFIHARNDADQIVANNIAAWDGAAWQTLATGVNGEVRALTTWDPDGAGPQSAILIAAGSFTHAGTVRVDYIAAWDGVAWRSLGWGFDAAAHGLTTWDPDASGAANPVLLAGGAFSAAGADDTGQVTAQRVAAWNGTVWSPMNVPNPVQGALATIIKVFDFDGDGPAPSSPVVLYGEPMRWDGAVWTTFTSLPPLYGWYSTMNVIGPPGFELFAYSANGMDFCQTCEGCPDCTCTLPCNWSFIRAQDGLGRGAGVGNSTAGVLGGWDPDGDSRTPLQVLAGSPAPPYLRAFAYEPPAFITGHPNDATTPAGGSVSFTVQVSDPSSHYSYRWSRWTWDWTSISDGVMPSGTIISGTRSPTLTIQNIAPADWASASFPNRFGATFKCYVSTSCDFTYTHPAGLRVSPCDADFNNDGDTATDADIEAFFACMAHNCCQACDTADFNGDGDTATDADIESFFRVLAGGAC